MQDHHAGLHRPRRSPLVPRRAEQDEPSIAALDVHRNGPAPARSDDHMGLVLVELVLGDLDGLLWELGIEDRVAVVLEKGRFDAARN